MNPWLKIDKNISLKESWRMNENKVIKLYFSSDPTGLILIWKLDYYSIGSTRFYK